MTNAQATTQTDECLDGLREVTRRLRTALGVTIVHDTTIRADDIGWWESPTNTVHIRAGATAEEQVWMLAQIWLMLVIGDHVVDPKSIEPMLSIVPPPTRT